MEVIRDLKENVDNIFVERLCQKIALELEHSKVVVFLSGGSVVNTYDRIAERLEELGIDYSKIQFGQIDERYDQDPMHENSNQKAIRETNLYKHFSEKGVEFNFILNGASREEEMERYSKYLNEIFQDDDVKVISILGVGDDFHTAGINPDSDVDRFNQRFLGEELVVGYDWDDYNRITQTYTAMTGHDFFFVYIMGEGKKQALEIMLGGEELPLHKAPNQFFKQKLEVTKIFTDIIG